MKRIIAAILTAMLLCTAIPALAQDIFHIVASVDTELREGPGTSYPVLSDMPSGDSATLVDENYSDRHGVLWYHVIYNGQEGFVTEDCTHKAPGVAPANGSAAGPEPTPIPTTAPTAAPVATPAPDSIAPDSIGSYQGAFSVTASSARDASINESIPVAPYCAADGLLNTAWNSYNESSGQWLRISPQGGGSYRVAGIRIAGGYWKNNEVYYANTRPYHISVYCDGMMVGSYEMQDRRCYQTFMFLTSVVCSTVEIRFTDHYYATEDPSLYTQGGVKDLCVTEVELVGEKGFTNPTPGTLNDWGSAVSSLAQKMMAGGSIAIGERSREVAGLQLLLSDGLHILSGSGQADGSFGQGTQAAVNQLQTLMNQSVPNCEAMTFGVVNGPFWRNFLKYLSLNDAGGYAGE